LGAAFHRAAHQVLEHGSIFSDPLALRILGVDAEGAVRDAGKDPSQRRLRLFIAVRTRFAEGALEVAVARGVRQVVLLGAGLDTYAYRASLGGALRIYEVDHPATQAWKRQRLDEAAIQIPSSLTFAPIDFERQTLEEGLIAAGFDPTEQAFFTWLGVVPYLTERAVLSTLGFISNLPGGAHVVFDYFNPPAAGPDQGERAVAHEALAARVASVGESFKNHFETDELQSKLSALGFRTIEDIGPASIRERYFAGRGGSAPNRGGHVVHAATLWPFGQMGVNDTPDGLPGTALDG
jgi:methyltransferase (TIGR00027 family)